MNIALFEDSGSVNLLPLTWLRSCCELRCGRDRLIDKVRARAGEDAGRGRAPVPVARVMVRPWLRHVVAERIPLDAADASQEWCLLNARAVLTAEVGLPRVGVVWLKDGDVAAVGLTARELDDLDATFFLDAAALGEWARRRHEEQAPDSLHLVRYPWDLIALNEEELRRGWQPPSGEQGTLYPGVHLVENEAIRVAAGARVKPGVVLDAEGGAIHVDRDALIEANAVVEGPSYIGRASIVRPGAAIRAGSSIGPVCRVGGEISHSILHGYANKQHDGYLGHSYLAEWTNLGADTVTSDLKNTYGTIRVQLNGVGVETGRQFLGSVIGDHSKTGIGTILPTGCIIGVAANVFRSTAIPKFVPSFAWLTDEGLTRYRVDKAVQIARTVMGRRNVELSEDERVLLASVAEDAQRVEAAGWS